jgi:MarR family 2-MHQ and catechol resistance regulon transcriptional repressor
MGTQYKGTEKEIRVLNTYIKLQRASESVIQRTTEHLSDYRLTLSQFAALEALYHLGTLSQVEVAAKLLKSTGNITTVLKNLEKRDLISRKRNPNDNRYMLVNITKEGTDLIESMLKKHITGIVEDMSILTPDEQIELARLCRKLGLQNVS